MPKKIPKRFWIYFWDVDATKVDPSKKPYFVVQRMLDKGNDKAVRWILRSFPRSLIKKTLLTLRDFNPKTGNFWANFLEIPKNKVLCLQEPYRRERKSHWPY